MTNEVLMAELKGSLRCERENMARFIERLREVDKRELFLAAGYGSLVTFCQKELGLSKSSSLKRVVVGRLSMRFPVILEMLRVGKTHLSTLCLVSKHLTAENHAKLLGEIAGKSEDDVKRIVARVFPKAEAELPSDNISWFTDEKGGVFFVGSAEVIGDLLTARNLLKHKYPDGKFAAVIGEALKLLIKKRMPAPVKAKAKAPTKAKSAPKANIDTRKIRRRIQREAYARYGHQCSFVAADGKRCDERAGLELDHIKPWALGGRSDDAANIRPLCFAHNRWLARTVFGKGHVQRRIDEKRGRAPCYPAARDGHSAPRSRPFPSPQPPTASTAQKPTCA